jgi:ATP-binding cassette subfamily C (CFTR/MRP) protein 4
VSFIAFDYLLSPLYILVKSFVLNHFVASIQGLTTIRALDAQKCLQQEFDHHQDVHASATYLLKTIVYSFSFWVDMMCLMYILLIIFSFLLFESRKLNQHRFDKLRILILK